MAHLEAVPARILEKHDIVPWRIILRPFHIPRPCLNGYPCQSIYLRATFSLERDPVLVRDVPGRLRDTKELRHLAIRCLELQPASRFHPSRKSKCRQQRLVKRGHISEPRDSQINVIETARHMVQLPELFSSSIFATL